MNNIENQKTSVAMYARQRDRDNIEREKFLLEKQKESLTTISGVNGYKIAGIYLDKGVGVTEDRPAYRQMMSDLKEKKFNRIIVTSSDRLFRRISDFVTFFKELQKYDCDLEIVSEKIVTSEPFCKMFTSILIAFEDMCNG